MYAPFSTAFPDSDLASQTARSSPARRRYVLCGAGHRALSLFVAALQGSHGDHGEVVGVVDPDPLRRALVGQLYPRLAKLPSVGLDDFDGLLRTVKPDALLVMSPDHCHAAAVLATLPMGIDCIVEKPLATNSRDLGDILIAAHAGPGRLWIAHNLRFSPLHGQIAKIIEDGAIGRPTLVELQWAVDVVHGSSYFRRWHRHRNCSGGLAVHKSSHHFDLVAYWLRQEPQQVYAQGARHHFGTDGALRPDGRQQHRCSTCDLASSCDVHQETEHWQRVSQNSHSGHRPTGSYGTVPMDTCAFAPGTGLRDQFACTVSFDGGAILNYSAHFAAPYSGFRLCVSGTRGRLEVHHRMATQRLRYQAPETSIEIFPLFGARQLLEVPCNDGAHDGADRAMLDAVFPRIPGAADRRLATVRDGVRSVAIGLATERSIDLGRPIAISEILSASSTHAPVPGVELA